MSHITESLCLQKSTEDWTQRCLVYSFDVCPQRSKASLKIALLSLFHISLLWLSIWEGGEKSDLTLKALGEKRRPRFALTKQEYKK